MATNAKSNRTWSEYLKIDAASRAAAKEKKEAELEAKHAAAVVELRERLLSSEEGRLCGKQLAECEQHDCSGEGALVAYSGRQLSHPTQPARQPARSGPVPMRRGADERPLPPPPPLQGCRAAAASYVFAPLASRRRRVGPRRQP
jgi:hypothetical protein